MSFQNQSGELLGFNEVVPGQLNMMGNPDKTSILTSRRRVRTTPQTGANVGAAGVGGGNQQIQFLIADQAGLIDMRSVVLNYTVQVSGASACCLDDGHPFMTVQALLNGQLAENVQNAPKLAVIEAFLGASKSYLETAGTFQGFELLSPDLDYTVGTPATANFPGWGFVLGNQPSCAIRCARAAAPVFNGIAGQQRSIPLGLVCGLGRCATYVPLSLLGELGIVLQTGSPTDVLFGLSATIDGNYSLSNISLEYDIITPDARYFALLKKTAMEDAAGLVLPYESSIVASGAAIAASTTLTENTIIVSRATNNLLRSNVVFVPTVAVSAQTYPSQSCFSHAGVTSVQWRIGSLVYPQVPCQGDAALFNMTLAAYGSVMQENGTAINRNLWGNSTNPATTPATGGVFETADAASGGSVRMAMADKFIPSYGFQTVKGGGAALPVDGVSVAAASGSQVIVSVIAAPAIAYTPFVVLTATKFIVAKNGAITIVGA